MYASGPGLVGNAWNQWQYNQNLRILGGIVRRLAADVGIKNESKLLPLARSREVMKRLLDTFPGAFIL